MLIFGVLLAGTGWGMSTDVAAAELGRHAQPRNRPKRAFANLPPSVRVCSLRASAREGARHDGTRVWVLYFGVRTMPPSASTKPDPPVPVLYSCRGEGIVFRSFHFSLVGEW